MMLYAAYGSNLHPLRLTERVSSAQLVATGLVPGWRLCFHKRSRDGSGKCSILEGGEGIHVAIFEINAADRPLLDSIEGLGAGYAERLLRVPEIGDCYAYVAEESHVDDSLAPYDWYKELVLLGARAHDFPESYLARISSQPACRDPNPGRRADSWKIVERIRTGGQLSRRSEE